MKRLVGVLVLLMLLLSVPVYAEELLPGPPSDKWILYLDPCNHAIINVWGKVVTGREYFEANSGVWIEAFISTTPTSQNYQWVYFPAEKILYLLYNE